MLEMCDEFSFYTGAFEDVGCQGNDEKGEEQTHHQKKVRQLQVINTHTS